MILLFGLGGVGFWIVGKGGSQLSDLLSPMLPKALAGIPSAIMFMAIIFGVLYEISQPIQSMNTDLVNWLPISPMEYVGGSTLSEAYIYSFLLCLLLGSVLGPAIAFGMGWAWLATAGLSILALLVGSLVVEILDATTNRISSSFYKKSGRSGILFRLIGTVIVLMLVQLIFSGYVVGFLLESIIQVALFAWFVPVVWPSLAVLGASQGNLVNFAVFSMLSIVFAVVLFVMAAEFRQRFWVPVPVSIKLSSGDYHPGRFHLPWIGATESALIQKDFRSLTRRREMARFLAIPFVLAFSIGLSLVSFSSDGIQGGPPFGFVVFFYILPITVFVVALSMTSIGQEGYAVWNIYAAPIKPNQIIRAKALFAGGLGLLFGVAILTILSFLVGSIGANFWILLMVGILAVLENSSMGLYFSARFPDFREMVRSRYVGVWGSVAGLLTSLAVSAATAAPVVLSVMWYGSVLPPLAVVSLAVGLVGFVIAWRMANRQVTRLLQNITI